MGTPITINIEAIYGKADGENATLPELPRYEAQALALAGTGNDVTLTGQGPIWLYLRLAHVLHGKACRLLYDSPVTGTVVIYDHNPF